MDSIDQLFNRYDAGQLTRRELFAAIASLALGALTPQLPNRRLGESLS